MTSRSAVLLQLMLSGAVVHLPACAEPGVRMNPNREEWKRDPTTLAKHVPFIGPVVRCAWVSGIDKDRNQGVPGPPSVYLRGYAEIPSEDLKQLQAKYNWKESTAVDAGTLPVPPSEPRFSGPVLVSPELVRALPSLSTYHQGNLYLIRQSNVVYFDLIKN